MTISMKGLMKLANLIDRHVTVTAEHGEVFKEVRLEDVLLDGERVTLVIRPCDYSIRIEDWSQIEWGGEIIWSEDVVRSS